MQVHNSELAACVHLNELAFIECEVLHIAL